MNNKKKRAHIQLLASVMSVTIMALSLNVSAEQYSWAAEKWADQRFKRSTLTKSEQVAELKWFAAAAKPLRDMKINVASESLATHQYESNVLAEAFEEITGITVNHEVIPEGDLVNTLQKQMQTDQNIYDAYVNDSDLIGTHFRSGKVVPIDHLMRVEGGDYTLPTLDLDDFIGLAFTTGPDGILYQLPTQQFANLYWYRADWFERPDLQKRFKEAYGYELDVPRNWSAYEDIAEFFTEDVQEIDGEPVYGHMDYGKFHPSLGWRFHDAWFSMAGGGDKGLPNGVPVDEWGIRVEDCRPVGAGVDRGGATNAPAAVYATKKYIHWLESYAPEEAKDMTFSEAGSVPGQGHIAQQIFWYTTFTGSMLDKRLPVVNADGTPKWRMAPSPRGAYWKDGMKLGYQDVGAWTFLSSTPKKRRLAAWLYAQFTVAKSVSLEKTLEGLTPIRESDINSDVMTEMAPRLGGLVEFYRSPARNEWTPTGTNVPDYPKLASLWWMNIGRVVRGEMAPRQALDNLAEALDHMLNRLEKTDKMEKCAPKLNEAGKARKWLAKPGAPRSLLPDENPKGKTVPYNELLRSWGDAP
ncbi:ABC transporter substrate-binding protein [Salicola sp. Rm-C-2C1-2]|uniref:ABC transporter substrate-binding protein n=1 Tax=Salicola sp. Rm-C-2C1-2 TaxID=3141321 RepID=UPI0032E4A16F